MGEGGPDLLHSSNQRAHFRDASRGWHMNQQRVPCTPPRSRWLRVTGGEGGSSAEDLPGWKHTPYFGPRREHTVVVVVTFLQEKDTVFLLQRFHFKHPSVVKPYSVRY